MTMILTHFDFISFPLMAYSKTPQIRIQQNKNLQTDFVKKTPKDKNQKQTDLFQCSYEMVHLIKKFHHISVNKLPTIDH